MRDARTKLSSRYLVNKDELVFDEVYLKKSLTTVTSLVDIYGRLQGDNQRHVQMQSYST